MKILIKYFGTQRKIAKTLGVTPAAVSQWFALGSVPPGHAVEIERITNGLVKAVDITKTK